MTSHDIVAKIKKITKQKVGHTGTLDPNATGVLPLLLGRGTLLCNYIIDHDKKYEATLKLGSKTDTADGEGKILEEKEVSAQMLAWNKVQTVCQNLQREQEQIPPMYSAIKIKGKKLYEYARKGQQVEVNARKITIYEIQLKNIKEQEKEIVFTVECSKGTYIRTLCEKIALELGTIGYMKELCRLQVGLHSNFPFSIEQAITLEDIEKQHIISIEDFFKNSPSIALEENKLKLFLNGGRIPYSTDKEKSEFQENKMIRVYNKTGHFIGIAEEKQGNLKRMIILD